MSRSDRAPAWIPSSGLLTHRPESEEEQKADRLPSGEIMPAERSCPICSAGAEPERPRRESCLARKHDTLERPRPDLRTAEHQKRGEEWRRFASAFYLPCHMPA